MCDDVGRHQPGLCMPCRSALSISWKALNLLACWISFPFVPPLFLCIPPNRRTPHSAHYLKTEPPGLIPAPVRNSCCTDVSLLLALSQGGAHSVSVCLSSLGLGA